MTLDWQAPPATAVRGGSKVTKWGQVASELRANPAKPDDDTSGWARVAVKTTRALALNLANGIEMGRRPEFEPAGHYQAAWSEAGERQYPVWARYVGESEQAEAAGGEWDDDEPE